MADEQDRLREYMKRWEIDPVDLAQLVGATRQGVYRWLTDPKNADEHRQVPAVTLHWCEANQALLDIWTELRRKQPSQSAIKRIVEQYLASTQGRIDDAKRSEARRRPSNWTREKHYMPIRVE